MRQIFNSLLLLVVTFFSLNSYAALLPNFAFRKIAVFPIKTDRQYGQVLEDAWTAIRAELTRDEQFMVATKAFMRERDAFQPRGSLVPLEVATLSKLLDADAIMTTVLDDRDLSLYLYDGVAGELLWSYTHRISAVNPVQNQLIRVVSQLTSDMVAAIPYHGFMRATKTYQKLVLKDKDTSFMHIKPRREGSASLGDPVQIVRLERVNMEPLFQKGGQLTVLAEGFVSGVEGDEFIVQLTRSVPQANLQLSDLVRLPKESERLEHQMEIIHRKTTLGIEYMAQELQLIEKNSAEKDQNRDLVTTGAFISSIVTFLLLAL